MGSHQESPQHIEGLQMTRINAIMDTVPKSC